MPRWNWRGHVTADLLRFDEGDLPPGRATEVESHLQHCSHCTDQLESIRRARRALSSELRPHQMPGEVSAVIRAAVMSSTPHSQDLDPRSIGLRHWPVAGAAALLVVMLLGWQLGRPWIGLRDTSAPPLAFERAAVALHEQAAHGGVRLDFESASPSAIRTWLHDKGAPAAKLATQPADSATRIIPVGAAVARLRGGSASLVRYEIDGHPVTLMTADADDTAGPSASWPLSKQITHRRDSGLDALTWTTGGQTYVLVSDLPGRGTQACLLCHADARFRQAVSRF
jgi:anti-sigma factor RsiW